MLRLFILIPIFLTVFQGFSQNVNHLTDSTLQHSNPKIKLKKRKVSRKDLKTSRQGLFTKDHKIIRENLELQRKQRKKKRKNPALTDPLYFGHAKLPNKNAKRREYCSTCQIVH